MNAYVYLEFLEVRNQNSSSVSTSVGVLFALLLLSIPDRGHSKYKSLQKFFAHTNQPLLPHTQTHTPIHMHLNSSD